MDVGRINKAGRYRKIDPRIWNDKKFRELSDRGKLLFIFVLTHPSMTSLGAMRATMSGLASELGWSEEAFREAFREASTRGMLEADEKASFVAAPNFVKFNAPENPNVVKSWIKSLEFIPECDLLIRLIIRVKGFVEVFYPSCSKVFTEGFVEVFPEAFATPLGTHEQEHEQEHEQQQHQGLIGERAPSMRPDVVASLRSELDAAGIKGSNVDRCLKVAGISPLTVLLVAQEAAAKADENPAGWIFKKLTSGFTPPRTLSAEHICKLARAGRIRSVCGVTVNGHIGHTNGALLIGQVGKQTRIEESKLQLSAIELTQRRP